MQNEKWNKFTENDTDPPYLIQSCKTTGKFFLIKFNLKKFAF